MTIAKLTVACVVCRHDNLTCIRLEFDGGKTELIRVGV